MATYTPMYNARTLAEKRIVGGEAHVVGENEDNRVWLYEVPVPDGTLTVEIAGVPLTEVETPTPAAGEFYVHYDDELAGAIDFNAAQAAASVDVDYSGIGSPLPAHVLAALQTQKVDRDGSVAWTGAPVPAVTLTHALGSATFRWNNIYTGGIDASGNATVAGTLGVGTSAGGSSGLVIVNGDYDTAAPKMEFRALRTAVGGSMQVVAKMEAVNGDGTYGYDGGWRLLVGRNDGANNIVLKEVLRAVADIVTIPGGLAFTNIDATATTTIQDLGSAFANYFKINVGGAVQPQVTINNANVILRPPSASGAVFINTYDDALSLVKVTNGGHVLIGTTSDAGYRLDISGTARATAALRAPVCSVTDAGDIVRGAFTNYATLAGGGSDYSVTVHSEDKLYFTTGGSSTIKAIMDVGGNFLVQNGGVYIANSQAFRSYKVDGTPVALLYIDNMNAMTFGDGTLPLYIKSIDIPSQRVTRGGIDSGGAGYRVLVVPN